MEVPEGIYYDKNYNMYYPEGMFSYPKTQITPNYPGIYISLNANYPEIQVTS